MQILVRLACSISIQLHRYNELTYMNFIQDNCPMVSNLDQDLTACQPDTGMKIGS